MKIGASIAIVAILGISMIGTAYSSGNDNNNNNNWFQNLWGNDDRWHKFWGDLDLKKIFASMNTGGSHDDDHDDNNDGTKSIIDNANIAIDVGIRPITVDGKNVFQNVANKCVFHSPDSFAPLCIKCDFLDKDGKTVVAHGEKIDLKSSYVGSKQITIPMSDPNPKLKDGEAAANGIDNVESVHLAICGVKEKCPDGTCKCDERKKDHSEHYYDFYKRYDDNKKKFGKAEYSTFMNDYENYINENGKYMDSYDFKMFMDYHGQFLKDHKNSYSDSDYKQHSKKHEEYSKDSPNHHEECDCHGEKEDHTRHYDNFDKSYKDNKKKFGKAEYSKFMNDYENYINEEGKYMDSSECKKFNDYDEQFLKNNKNYFSNSDYQHHSEEHEKHSKDCPKHDEEENECKEKSGFFVGGGKVKSGTTYVTHGFELHCDKTMSPNNLEINWKVQNKEYKFHLDQLVSAMCTDEPGYQSQPPPSPHPGPTLDTYTGEGYGLYNGKCGAYATWTMTDEGEPGTKDRIISLKISETKDGPLVLNIDSPLHLEKGGNHQFVPHPASHPNPTTQTTCPKIH